jgi:hypothetical protein
MKSHELLILNYQGFEDRLNDLYTRLEASRAMQEAFVRDPAGVIARLVLPGLADVTDAEINQANRLMFALLSNDGFMQWTQAFQERIEAQAREASTADDPAERLRMLLVTFDRPALYREVAQAALDHIDLEIIHSMMVRSPESIAASALGQGREVSLRPNVRLEIEIFAVAVLVLIVFAIDITPLAPNRAPEGLSRTDLQRVAAAIADGMSARARDLRASGALLAPDATTRGPQL